MNTPKAKAPVKMQKVDSSNIHSIGYDPETKTLHVQFQSGATYHYLNVPEETHLALDMAESAGRYMNENIKGKFQFVKA